MLCLDYLRRFAVVHFNLDRLLLRNFPAQFWLGPESLGAFFRLDDLCDLGQGRWLNGGDDSFDVLSILGICGRNLG